jgi:hypothetical protein
MVKSCLQKTPSKLHKLVDSQPPIVINIKSWNSDSIISTMETKAIQPCKNYPSLHRDGG